MKTIRINNKDIPQSGNSVLGHTIAAIKSNFIIDNPTLNLAILFHDVGKNDKTYKLIDNWKHSYHSHDYVGMKMMDSIARRLTMPNDVRDAIKFVCEKHMNFHKLNEVRISKIIEWKDSPYWNYLKLTAKADSYSRGEFLGRRDWNKITTRLDEVDRRPSYKDAQAAVSGNRIMELRGWSQPSSKVGVIKKAAIDAIGNGIITNDGASIDKFIKEYKID